MYRNRPTVETHDRGWADQQLALVTVPRNPLSESASRRRFIHADVDSRSFNTLRVLNTVLLLIPNMEVSSLTGSPC
jgi:hypothetical protein